MLADAEAFSGFAVDDIEKAHAFYEETLGLRTTVLDAENGLLNLNLAGGRDTLVYLSPDFTPASYTILNFKVDDIDAAVDELAGRGVSFERYDEFPQDEKGVMREGEGVPMIAWFKDPAGNILSVLQER
jgi:catechol 2,3-dioxygenase-like lactoylglutathione lyase family enzyme